jgi:hypothetical protein
LNLDKNIVDVLTTKIKEKADLEQDKKDEHQQKSPVKKPLQLFAVTVHLRNEQINPTSEKWIQSRIDEKKRFDSGEIRTKNNIKP